MNYNKLYFAEIERPELDITKAQTTVGITIKAGNAFVKWAHTAGDLGGEPESLDCTPLSALVQMNKTGILTLDNWTIDYYYNDEDFTELENQKKSSELVDIAVTLPNGTKFTNKGHCTANYPTGVAVNGMMQGHAVFELSNPDGWGFVPAETTPTQPASTLSDTVG